MRKSYASPRKHPLLRRLITLLAVFAAAWLLGQAFAPALMKALFL